jgi:hypothetical protein
MTEFEKKQLIRLVEKAVAVASPVTRLEQERREMQRRWADEDAART